MDQATDKRLAAEAAAALIEPGMLVGLGTGTTTACAIAALGRRVAGGLAVTTVATSVASRRAAEALGIRVLPFDDIAAVDLTIDGVDEVDPQLRAIKGGGGAMLREKIVAAASTRMIAVADGSKLVDRLGTRPVPLEVLPLARAWVARAVSGLGGDPVPREGFVTDQGNVVLDARFAALPDPAALATALSAIPGMLGHGIFLDEIDELIASRDGHVTHVQRPRGRQEP